MCGFNDLFHFGLYFRHFDSMLRGETDHIDLSSHVVSLLHRSERKSDGFRRPPLYIHVPFGRRHANHLIINAIYSYIFATRVFSRFEKTFINSFSDDTYFARFLYIHLIDESAVCHFLRFNVEIIRIQPFHATIIFLIFIYGFGTPTGYGRSNDLHLFHLGTKTVDVGRFQIPPSPFAEAFVSLTRSLRGKETGIGGKSFKVLFHHVLQSLSAADEGDEHEDSPENTECSQQASRLISCNGDEDFLTRIHVYSHSLNLL